MDETPHPANPSQARQRQSEAARAVGGTTVREAGSWAADSSRGLEGCLLSAPSSLRAL